MALIKRFLIIKANGATRLTTRYPSLGSDEIAVRLNITMPSGWGKIQGEINVTMPDFPTVETHDLP